LKALHRNPSIENTSGISSFIYPYSLPIASGRNVSQIERYRSSRQVVYCVEP
jgi:hypothetical protein